MGFFSHLFSKIRALNSKKSSLSIVDEIELVEITYLSTQPNYLHEREYNYTAVSIPNCPYQNENNYSTASNDIIYNLSNDNIIADIDSNINVITTDEFGPNFEPNAVTQSVLNSALGSIFSISIFCVCPLLSLFRYVSILTSFLFVSVICSQSLSIYSFYYLGIPYNPGIHILKFNVI